MERSGRPLNHRMCRGWEGIAKNGGGARRGVAITAKTSYRGMCTVRIQAVESRIQNPGTARPTGLTTIRDLESDIGNR